MNNCKVQFKFTVFRVELFDVELPACTVVRCRVFVQSYPRVELVGVESDRHVNILTKMCSQTINFTKLYSKMSRIRLLCWNCSSYFTVKFGKIYRIFLISLVPELLGNSSRTNFSRVHALWPR